MRPTSRRSLAVAGLALGWLSCGRAYDEADVSGRWQGAATPPAPFYVDEVRITLEQRGQVLTGQGQRGVPCPADGTCYAPLSASGTIDGIEVVLHFTGPYEGEKFVGRLEDSQRLRGVFTTYWGTPPLTLTRMP